jgi:hypothetical protein
LQYRPRSDTIDTLLHEAIHAYFFITTSWRHSRGDDGTGHGVGFQLLADAVNNHGNYEVTIYHTFHDEVETYRTHVWQCDGPCRSQPPFFGLVKRSMNRAPGKSDTWWLKHEAECGGMYTKIKEPTMTKKQLDALSAKERAGRQKNKLDSWITASAKTRTEPGDTSNRPIDVDEEEKTSRSANNKRKASTLKAEELGAEDHLSKSAKRTRATTEDEDTTTTKTVLVTCPICSQSIPEPQINQHLDTKHLF